MWKKDMVYLDPKKALPENLAKHIENLWVKPRGDDSAAFLDDQGEKVEIKQHHLERGAIWTLQPLVENSEEEGVKLIEEEEVKLHNGFILDNAIFWCFKLIESLGLSTDTFYVDTQWTGYDASAANTWKERLSPLFKEFNPAQHNNIFFPVNLKNYHWFGIKVAFHGTWPSISSFEYEVVDGLDSKKNAPKWVLKIKVLLEHVLTNKGAGRGKLITDPEPLIRPADIYKFFTERAGDGRQSLNSSPGTSWNSACDVASARELQSVAETGVCWTEIDHAEMRGRLADGYSKCFKSSEPEATFLQETIMADRDTWLVAQVGEAPEITDMQGEFIEGTKQHRWGDHYDIVMFSRMSRSPVIIFSVNVQSLESAANEGSRPVLTPKVLVGGRLEPALPVLLLHTQPESKTKAHYSILMPILPTYENQLLQAQELHSGAVCLVQWCNVNLALVPSAGDGNCLFNCLQFWATCLDSNIIPTCWRKIMADTSQQAMLQTEVHPSKSLWDELTDTCVPDMMPKVVIEGTVEALRKWYEANPSKYPQGDDVASRLCTGESLGPLYNYDITSLAQLMKAPIVVLDSVKSVVFAPDQESVPVWLIVPDIHSHAKNGSYLPTCVGSLQGSNDINERAQAATTYAVAFPWLEPYSKQYEAALRLVDVHPRVYRPSVGPLKHLQFAVFPGISGTGSLFYASELARLCRTSWMEGIECTTIKRCVDKPACLVKKINDFNKLLVQAQGGKFTQNLAQTYEHKGAWDESSGTTTAKHNIAREWFHVSINKPNSVVADFGAGLGSMIFAQEMFSKTVRVVGIEQERQLFKFLTTTHAKLLELKWTGNVAASCDESTTLKCFEGVTNAYLYDGNQVHSANEIPTGQGTHFQLMRIIVSTKSIDEFTSTKFRESSWKRYGEIDQIFKDMREQFYPVQLVTIRFKKNRIYPTMWVRRKKYRLSRSVEQGVYATTHGSRIEAMIAAADHDKQTSDPFDRYVFPSIEGDNQKEAVVRLKLTGSDQSKVNVLVKATMNYLLTGEVISPGKPYTFPSQQTAESKDMLEGFFAGVLIQSDGHILDPPGFVMMVVVSDEEQHVHIVPQVDCIPRAADIEASARDMALADMKQRLISGPVYMVAKTRRSSRIQKQEARNPKQEADDEGTESDEATSAQQQEEPETPKPEGDGFAPEGDETTPGSKKGKKKRKNRSMSGKKSPPLHETASPPPLTPADNQDKENDKNKGNKSKNKDKKTRGGRRREKDRGASPGPESNEPGKDGGTPLGPDGPVVLGNLGIPSRPDGDGLANVNDVLQKLTTSINEIAKSGVRCNATAKSGVRCNATSAKDLVEQLNECLLTTMHGDGASSRSPVLPAMTQAHQKVKQSLETLKRTTTERLETLQQVITTLYARCALSQKHAQKHARRACLQLSLIK